MTRDRDTLTAREVQIVRFAATGDSNKVIALRGHVTEQTVKFHFANAYRKLGVANRTAAVWRCLELGLIDPPRRTEPRLSGDPANHTGDTRSTASEQSSPSSSASQL